MHAGRWLLDACQNALISRTHWVALQVYTCELLMDALLTYSRERCAVDPLLARFLTHLALSHDRDVRARVRADATVAAVVDLSQSAAGGTVQSQEVAQLQTVLAAAEQPAGTLSAAAVRHWPGGRHDNDHTDFRAINIEPSAAEILDEAPFLPMADGSDQFLAGQV